MSATPTIGLCVCTRNRPKELHRALRSVMRSSLRPTQTIVSDDSDPRDAHETAAVCSQFRTISYVTGPHRGLSQNRNNCLDHLSAMIDAVVFIDDDVVLPTEFLATAAQSLAREGKGAIITGYENRAGFVVTPHNPSFLGFQERPPRSTDDVHAICINATVFPRSVFTHVRFDPLLHYGCEEVDLCARAEQIGFRIVFNPDMCVDHSLSPINRAEYSRFQDASRLYTTYKRYRWIQGSRAKAVAYAIAAPVHLVGAAVRRRRVDDMRSCVASIATAIRYVRRHGGEVDGATRRAPLRREA